MFGQRNPTTVAALLITLASTAAWTDQRGEIDQHGTTPPLFWTLTWDGQHMLAKIPRTALGKDFLIILQVVDAQPAVGQFYPGMVERASASPTENVTFHWRATANDSIQLTPYSGEKPEEGSPATAQAFPIIRREADGTMIADVSDFFKVQWRSAPPQVTSAQNHLEVELTQTLQDQRVSWRWNIMPLPASPMRPRVSHAQHAIFFGVPAATCPQPKASYITRWRLRKKDPTATVSDVVRPIVYEIDPRTPPQWVPWIKRGVEEWTSVFDTIGFRHAILVREARQASELSWSPWDAHPMRTAIFWYTPEDARRREIGGRTSFGTTYLVADPRSGEILHATIQLDEGAIPAAVEMFHMPAVSYADSSIQQLVQAMTAIEVGHSLGLSDVFSASPMAVMLHNAHHGDSVPSVSQFTQIRSLDQQAIEWGYSATSQHTAVPSGNGACPSSP